MDSDKRLILLSALQHYAFCPRQCALIHNEQAWAENYLTAQGKLLHERVDGGEPETRQGTRFERSVHVLSDTLGLSGVLDMVEVSKNGDMHPVEYKHGKPKPTDIDKIQLCSQAMCLEEMTGRTVASGSLWYGKTRHRLAVVFDEELRAKTLATIDSVRTMLQSGQTPLPIYDKRCKACSLVDICEPKLLQKDKSIQYAKQLFE
ncbi:CRISPR-associated protein Cas4 [Moraxella ovis]|uniref:CRISPR-associated exonuclease Cas4 n=1 Tax=Moraxella ovis TaxID=29433 RepID=A0A378PJG4_9GAMM|nr:CRISPR-associated protein Cas4 [Moraxella ovis]ANB91335.1 CRISPR-associated protein Cas4 [Moraxella ovis]STY86904.1 CRISPR-associated protein Cas4 [Moraxella ovis]